MERKQLRRRLLTLIVLRCRGVSVKVVVGLKTGAAGVGSTASAASAASAACAAFRYPDSGDPDGVPASPRAVLRMNNKHMCSSRLQDACQSERAIRRDQSLDRRVRRRLRMQCRGQRHLLQQDSGQPARHRSASRPPQAAGLAACGLNPQSVTLRPVYGY